PEMAIKTLFAEQSTEPPKMRSRYEGSLEVQEQYNPKTMKWEEVGRGPRWAPQQAQQTQDPSAVAEWKYYQSLSPEQQTQYLLMKRANPYLDLGGEKTAMNPAA